MGMGCGWLIWFSMAYLHLTFDHQNFTYGSRHEGSWCQPFTQFAFEANHVCSRAVIRNDDGQSVVKVSPHLLVCLGGQHLLLSRLPGPGVTPGPIGLILLQELVQRVCARGWGLCATHRLRMVLWFCSVGIHKRRIFKQLLYMLELEGIFQPESSYSFNGQVAKRYIRTRLLVIPSYRGQKYIYAVYYEIRHSSEGWKSRQ